MRAMPPSAFLPATPSTRTGPQAQHATSFGALAQPAQICARPPHQQVGRLQQTVSQGAATSLRAAPNHAFIGASEVNPPCMAPPLAAGMPAEQKRLIPVEQVVGLEGLRPLEQASPFSKKNNFPRFAVPGLGVSRHWESRVHNLRAKGPFPTQQAQISLTLGSGKSLNAVVTYPTQQERGQNKNFPLVLYSPPGFVGELKFPGMSFFDAQLGLPMMSHFASYGMVSVTLLEPSSVLRDGVKNVDHQAQANELNELIDQLLAPNGPLAQHALPAVDPTKVGMLAYSRGAKVALLAAADRLQAQRMSNEHSESGTPEGSRPPVKIVTIAKDPVNLGGVPPAVLDQIPPCTQELIPETYNSWKESSNRYPVAPLPNAPANEHFPIEDVTDPVLMFSGQLNWVNSDPRYAAKVFYDALPSDHADKNLLVEVNGTHESWVNDYEIKGDSMALMTAYLLTHLADRDKFQSYLTPETILENGKTFNRVTQGPTKPNKQSGKQSQTAE